MPVYITPTKDASNTPPAVRVRYFLFPVSFCWFLFSIQLMNIVLCVCFCALCFVQKLKALLPFSFICTYSFTQSPTLARLWNYVLWVVWFLRWPLATCHMPHAARAALQKPAASIPPASLSAAAAILDQCYLYVYSGFFLLRPPSVASSNLRKKKILNTYLAGHANINNSRFLKYRSAEKFKKKSNHYERTLALIFLKWPLALLKHTHTRASTSS